MHYFNENLRNWLLGKSEIDHGCSMAIPPSESPQDLLDKFKITKDDKIVKKLNKLGYDVKTVYILSKKSSVI